MEDDPKNYVPERPGGWFYVVWVVLVVAVIGLTVGLVLARNARMNRQTAQLERVMARGPRVLVRRVTQAPRVREIELPASLSGYIQTPIYAKVSGYLKNIYVDKGDRVTKGQLIAILDSPELDHQVANARANYQIAQLTDKRNEFLIRRGVIAQQVADESRASMLEAKAALQQLLVMQAYETIRAPFSGVITARYVDPGVLIPQVTTPSASSTPIVEMATLSPMRVYADVPQSIAPFVHNGDPATITVTEYPGREYKGVITRHPEALQSASRTMLVEVDLPNKDRSLYPGMYAKLKFTTKVPSGVPMVPDDALVFLNGKPYVPIVRNDHLKLAAVTLGYDNGINVEITKGIQPDDVVAINVGQAVQNGEPVQPVVEHETN